MKLKPFLKWPFIILGGLLITSWFFCFVYGLQSIAIYLPYGTAALVFSVGIAIFCASCFISYTFIDLTFFNDK